MKMWLFGLMFLVANAYAGEKPVSVSHVVRVEHISELLFTDASEEAYSTLHKQKLQENFDSFKFTFKTMEEVKELFEELKKDPKARMKRPKGLCAQRRYHIQEKLEDRGITTGKLYVQCPSNRGVLKLKDRVSGSYYTYSNYHDVNIMAVGNAWGVDLYVLDLQFEDGPLPLSTYLGEIEANQKIRPLKKRPESPKGLCYWSVSTDYFSY